MASMYGTGVALGSARKRLIIKEIQAAVSRELAAQSRVDPRIPQNVADV